MKKISTISDAQTALNLLEAYGKDKERTTKTSVASLGRLGAEIHSRKYETKFSRYVFESPQEISTRQEDIDLKWVELDQLSVQKKGRLDAELGREQEKERLRLEFAHAASEFVRWTKDAGENIAGTHFGFTLEEVSAFRSQLDSQVAERNTEADALLAHISTIKAEMDSLSVTDNNYTTLSLSDLDSARNGHFNGAVQQTYAAYQTELDRQIANDNLCQEFAKQVDPFSKQLSQIKDQITLSKEDLPGQLKYVEQRLASVDADSAPLKGINATAAEMEARGITVNKHSTLTAKDVQVQWEQYKIFLQRKKAMLEEEVERQKLRGVTPDQFREIESNFKQFDADSDGSLDRKEFKTCLYSLGEEKTNSEIDALMAENGNGKWMPYEGYKKFMVNLLGVSDSKEDILAGFELIGRHSSSVHLERLQLAGLSPSDIAYITSTAPRVGDDTYDFPAWTTSVFAR